MRILLQHARTGLYLKSLNKWTANPKDALAFLDTVRAHDYSIYHRLSETVIVPLTEPDRHTIQDCRTFAGSSH